MAKANPTLPRKPYRALRPLRHDGDDIAVGATVQLTDDQAVELAALGAVDPKPVPDPAPAA